MARKPPEGWADLGDYYESSGQLEDTVVTSGNYPLPAFSAKLSLDVHNHTKGTPEMMQGWRTIIFNVGLAVVGVLQTASWVDVLPAAYVGPLVAVIGMVGIWLRSVTKTPVGVK